MSVVYYILITIATLLILLILPHVLIILTFILLSFTISMKKNYTKQSKFYYYIFNLGYWSLFTCAGAKLHVSGLEKLPSDKKFMFTSNHRSNFDNMIHSYAMREYPIAFISKKENFRIPFARKFMKRCFYLSLDRGNHRQGFGIIQQAADMLKENHTNIGIFPEGTRAKDLQLRPYKPGCFKIATQSNSPIVVGVIQGTENLKKNFPFKKTDVYFDIVEVIYPEQYENMNTIEIAQKVQNLVEEKIKTNDNR